METTTKIKQYIRHIAPQPYTEVRLGRVVSVEGDTCTIDLDGLEIDGVSLRPIQDSSNLPLRITPAVGAFAIVADLFETLRKAVGIVGVSQDIQDQWLANVSRFAAYKAARVTDMIREAVAANDEKRDGTDIFGGCAIYCESFQNRAGRDNKRILPALAAAHRDGNTVISNAVRMRKATLASRNFRNLIKNTICAESLHKTNTMLFICGQGKATMTY